MLPVQNRKRKLSAASLIKKIKEESEAEKRKKIRLEWYLKQLLLEKEMLVKENEIEFAQAMQSIMNQQDAAAPALLSTAPLAINVNVPTTAPSSCSSSPSSIITMAPASLDATSAASALFSLPDEETDMYGLRVASPGPTSEDSTHTTTSDDHLLTPGVFATSSALTLDDECCSSSSKPALSSCGAAAAAEETFNTEWENQINGWWDEDELSQFLAVPPSLMV